MAAHHNLIFHQKFCAAIDCRAMFFICSHCDRGHRYCSHPCRLRSRLEQRRAARQRHQRSVEGRLDHRDRQRAYRLRQAAARRASGKNSVTDHTPQPPPIYALLQEKSVRDLTMEEVAKLAKVGKPTLYKWWPTKATLVLAMLCERMAPNLEQPSDLTAEESLRFRVRSLIDAFNGPFGKIVAGLIAEG